MRSKTYPGCMRASAERMEKGRQKHKERTPAALRRRRMRRRGARCRTAPGSAPGCAPPFPRNTAGTFVVCGFGPHGLGGSEEQERERIPGEKGRRERGAQRNTTRGQRDEREESQAKRGRKHQQEREGWDATRKKNNREGRKKRQPPLVSLLAQQLAELLSRRALSAGTTERESREQRE